MLYNKLVRKTLRGGRYTMYKHIVNNVNRFSDEVLIGLMIDAEERAMNGATKEYSEAQMEIVEACERELALRKGGKQ